MVDVVLALTSVFGALKEENMNKIRNLLIDYVIWHTIHVKGKEARKVRSHTHSHTYKRRLHFYRLRTRLFFYFISLD